MNKAENKLIKNVCRSKNCEDMTCLIRTTNDGQLLRQAGSLIYSNILIQNLIILYFINKDRRFR